VERVDSRADIREFLTLQRARITPERAGLPAYGRNRRVKGGARSQEALDLLASWASTPAAGRASER